MTNIVHLDTFTRLDMPPDRVLSEAMEASLTGVVILGTTADGEEFFRSSIASGPEVVWLLERCKALLMRDDES